jgi:hypothetical protein
MMLTMTPITLRVHVAQVQTALLAKANICNRAGNLTRDECATTARALVVEQDAITRVHSVRLTVVDDNPVGVQLRNTIRRARVERSRLALRGLHDLAVQLGRGCLIEPHVALESARPDRVKQAERPESIDVSGVLGHLKGHFDVRLRTEVIDLRRLYLRDDVYEVSRVGQIAIVQLELVGTYGKDEVMSKGAIDNSTYAHAGLRIGDEDDRC